MIEFRQGNLLEAAVDALVNTVNCVGVMGKGIALQFRQAFPENYKQYERACSHGEVRLGRMFVHQTGRLTPSRFIINFPTKNHWRAMSRLGDIQSGLADLIEVVRQREITSIALPPLGCGHGGLDWDDVYPLIKTAFEKLPQVDVWLFAPQPTPASDTMPIGTSKPRMTRSRALLVQLINRYREPGYRNTKLEMQKLAYFLQEAGEPLRLKFVKHQFGPYAENLNHALRDMEGHLIRGFGDRHANSSIYPMPGAVEEATSFMADDNDARVRLERVAQLIRGYESPYGLELLATVHWVSKHDPKAARDSDSATTAVLGWSKRKKTLFRPEHVAKVWQRLREQAWLD